MKIINKLLISILSLTMMFTSITPLYAMEEEPIDEQITEENQVVEEEPVIEEEEEIIQETKDESDETMIDVLDTYINPNYSNVYSSDELTAPKEKEANPRLRLASNYVYSDINSAAVFMRNGLVNREEVISLKYTFKSSDAGGDSNGYAKEISRQISAVALSHTGNPVEGDYIDWQFGGYHAKISGSSSSGVFTITITYTVTYYTSLEQEIEMDSAVYALLDTLDVYDGTNYEKVKAIYEWMCSHITYDYFNLNDESYVLKYTAYGALINRTCVCQGYSNLFYRLALELGVDARIITGKGNGGDHAWNIVKIGNYYYNLDSTWDAGRTTYSNFLVNESAFSRSHIRDVEYSTSAFMNQYVISPITMVPVHSIAFDQEDMYVERDTTGTLTYTLYPNNELVNQYVVWSNSNPNVVQLNEDGSFVCLKPGRSVITVTTPDEKQDSIFIKVLHADIENGWYEEDGYFYYYENRDEVTGWHMVDGKNYEFNLDGSLKTGWYNVNQVYSYVDPTTGKFVTSTKKKINNSWYYFDVNGIMQTKSYTIDGDVYYFNSDGSMKTGWVQDGSYYKYVDEKLATYIKSEWRNFNSKWYYFDEQGRRVTGYYEVKGIPYFFNGDGTLYQGWKTYNGDTYYFTLEGAANEWYLVDGKQYYFVDYKRVSGYIEIDGIPYFFNTDGTKSTGWQSINGSKYYFKNGVAQDGWQAIDNKWYYFDSYKTVTGLQKIDNTLFSFNTDGSLYAGWKEIEDDWYYFTNKGAVNGFSTINGKLYYFSAYKMVTGFKEIDGIPYYFNEDGSAYTGWKDSYYFTEQGASNGWKTIDGNLYYFRDYESVKGYIEVDGQPYMFDDKGVAYNGWVQENDDWYYFIDGQSIQGWKSINGKWYYFDDYRMVVGYLEIEGVPYFFNDNGSLFSTGWKKVDGVYYYFTSKGALNGWQKINNVWYYFDSYKMAIGYIEIDGIPYYLNDNGSLYGSGWKKVNGVYYYFKGTGALNGWQKINDIWYYFDQYKMVTGYIEIENIPYYFNDNGSLFSGWKKIDGLYYYFKSSGAVNGWQKINDVWYYFEQYKMVSNVRLQIDGYYYYFNTNGSMATGWVLNDQAWRYYQSGGKEATGWLKLDGKWYYLDPDNENYMVKNITMSIDGKNYTFNTKGVLI